MKARGRPKITWKQEQPKKLLIPHGQVEPRIDPEHLRKFFLGALFFSKHNLRKNPQWPAGYKNHELSYISKLNYPSETAVVKPFSTPMVYMGQVRVEEQMGNKVVQILRHVFLVGNTKYMLLDLNLLYSSEEVNTILT